MKQIKFSHHYQKLDHIDTKHPVQLLDATHTTGNLLSQTFIQADTWYHDPGEGAGYHPPIDQGQDYILLIFKDSQGTMFTTLRKDNPENILLYDRSIGEWFDIVFTRDKP